MRGFLGRVGKEWGQQANSLTGYNMKDLLGGPAMLAGIGGATAGGVMGGLSAAAQGGDPLGDAAHYGGIGAAGMGAAGALASGTVGIKQLIIAVARAMKQKMPNQADEAILQQAHKVVQSTMSRPDARAQLEKILGTKLDWGGQ